MILAAVLEAIFINFRNSFSGRFFILVCWWAPIFEKIGWVEGIAKSFFIYFEAKIFCVAKQQQYFHPQELIYLNNDMSDFDNWIWFHYCHSTRHRLVAFDFKLKNIIRLGSLLCCLKIITTKSYCILMIEILIVVFGNISRTAGPNWTNDTSKWISLMRVRGIIIFLSFGVLVK